MRARWLVTLIGIIAVVGVAMLVRSAADASSSSRARSGSVPREEMTDAGALPAVDVMAGSVGITIEPIRIDASGALFRVTMDTHSGDLSVDPAASSALTVDGVEWSSPTWTGDPPGGHHRQGELAFEAGGPATGEATLSIGGFSAPVEASWSLGG